MAKQFQVSVSILGGKIEYMCRRPYGVIVISMEGEREEKEKAAAYMMLVCQGGKAAPPFWRSGGMVMIQSGF